MQLVVDTLLTTYQRVGNGEVILIVHGWGDNSAGWTEFSNRLSANYEVIALDLPGFGGTQAPPEAWDLTAYATFVASFLNKLGVRPYALIGHSNGGAIAIRGISMELFTPEKLVLLASSGVRGEYKGRNKILRLITKFGKLLTMPLPASIKKRLQRKVYKTIGSDMLVAENLQETFKLVVTDDVRADAKHIQVPTLLVYGDKDPATPLKYARALQQAIPNSRLEILPGVEHFVHLEEADQVQQLVEGFLRRA